MKEPLKPERLRTIRRYLKNRDGVTFITRRAKELLIEDAEKEQDDFWGDHEHEVEDEC